MKPEKRRIIEILVVDSSFESVGEIVPYLEDSGFFCAFLTNGGLLKDFSPDSNHEIGLLIIDEIALERAGGFGSLPEILKNVPVILLRNSCSVTEVKKSEPNLVAVVEKTRWEDKLLPVVKQNLLITQNGPWIGQPVALVAKVEHADNIRRALRAERIGVGYMTDNIQTALNNLIVLRSFPLLILETSLDVGFNLANIFSAETFQKIPILFLSEFFVSPEEKKTICPPGVEAAFSIIREYDNIVFLAKKLISAEF